MDCLYCVNAIWLWEQDRVEFPEKCELQRVLYFLYFNRLNKFKWSMWSALCLRLMQDIPRLFFMINHVLSVCQITWKVNTDTYHVVIKCSREFPHFHLLRLCAIFTGVLVLMKLWTLTLKRALCMLLCLEHILKMTRPLFVT